MARTSTIDGSPPEARPLRRPTTLVGTLKAGVWESAMAAQLDEDLLPDCPFPGVSACHVWECLRELQVAYQERQQGWRDVPAQFERLARALPTLVALGA